MSYFQFLCVNVASSFCYAIAKYFKNLICGHIEEAERCLLLFNVIPQHVRASVSNFSVLELLLNVSTLM